jgi:outer membrane protein assembly factor BamB
MKQARALRSDLRFRPSVMRSGRLRAIAANVVALTILSVFLGDAGAAGTDTAVAYQINVAHNGVQVDNALSPPFVRRWQVTLPGPVSYPLVAHGLVFVTADDGSVPTLYALNQASGQTVWSQPLVQPPPVVFPWANAAYDSGRVFAVGSAGVMTAYDAGTGALLWTTMLPFQYLFSTPPTAANGVVYTGGAGTGGTVYAVNQTTGVVLATQSVQNGDTSSPALSDSSMFVSYACNQAYGFVQTTLGLLWHYHTGCEGGGGRTAVYANGRVFTRDFFGNLILDAASGNLLGTYGPSNGSSIAAPAVSGNTMWLLSGGTLSAQDISVPSSPSTLWSFTGDGQLVSAPIVLSTSSGTFIIEGSASGMLYALNAATGAQVWSTNLGAAIQPPDEYNILSQPLTGLGAGQGLLVVPAGDTVSAFFSGTPLPASLATPIPTLSEGMLVALVLLLTVLAVDTIRPRR